MQVTTAWVVIVLNLANGAHCLFVVAAAAGLTNKS